MSPELRRLWRAKLQACGIHLAISAALFAAIIAVGIELWYPPPYFWIDGGLWVVRIAAIVDVILGPLLTLVVFRPGKRLLALNLAVIAFFQAAFLTWGVLVMYQQRPLLAAFVGAPSNRFFPITEEFIRDGGRPLEELLALSPERPAQVSIRLPEDIAEVRTLLAESFGGGGSSVLRRTELFEPLRGAQLERMLAGARDERRLAALWPLARPRIERFLAERGARFEDYAFVPIHGRYYIALAAFERATGRYAGALYTHDRLRASLTDLGARAARPARN